MRHEDPQAATAWMRRAVSMIDFSTCPIVLKVGGWNVHVDESLSLGWAAVVEAPMAIVFSSETYEALKLCPDIMARVLHDLRNGASGLKMLTAEIVQKLVRIQELGIAREDELDRLEKLAKQLILESASINGQHGVSANTIAQFTLRSSELQESYQFLSMRMRNLQAVIEASTNSVEDVI